ncbi:HesA/MoeB/ThiF family protein [Pelagibacterium montanilacus]|uniref:HesA/MoeB/ThiF family protein n=1 Tax=Pelagibacterium montanilacus TaxID=2185280 RepID=UPI001FE53156|nr:HesA/MoeB/ThiF family protein [Pelagibacterium montanilacus]
MLSPPESRRHARHLVLKGIGASGQQAIAGARVLVVGAGGLGAPVITALAAAGIGTLGVCDHDTVSLSNLPRQTLFRDSDVGASKALCAVREIGVLNPHGRASAHAERLVPDNAGALVENYDLVVEGSDDFACRRHVAAACARARIPLVTGAVGQFDGTVTVLAPYSRDGEGKPYPTLEALYPHAPSPEDIPTCEQAGVLSVLPAVVGAMMANEALKLVAGYGEPLLGKLALYSARTGETRILGYR